MKKLTVNCLFLIFFNFSFGQSARKDEQTLLTIETQRLEAIVNHNHDYLLDLYDDEFHGIIASGHAVDKTKMIEFLETGSPLVFQSVEDVKVRILDGVAITTGKLVSKSKSGSVIGQSRFTHIYVKKYNQWVMIESQGTVIIQE